MDCDVCFYELVYVQSLCLGGGPVNLSFERMGAPLSLK